MSFSKAMDKRRATSSTIHGVIAVIFKGSAKMIASPARGKNTPG